MASRASTRTLCASREGASEQGLSSLAAYRAQARSFAQDSTLCSWPWPVRCNSRLFWVAPQLVFGLLQEFARVMQVVIMHQRRRAVRPGAMKTATPSTDCPCSANEDVTDKLRAGCKSITSSGYEVAEPQCKSGPSCANHCRSRECRCASLDWRLLVTTCSIQSPVRYPDAIWGFVLQHWHWRFASLHTYVDTHLQSSSVAPIGPPNVTVLGLGGSSLRFDLPRRSAGRSFLGLNEAEQQSFARHRVSCASWSASQCGIQ